MKNQMKLQKERRNKQNFMVNIFIIKFLYHIKN